MKNPRFVLTIARECRDAPTYRALFGSCTGTSWEFVASIENSDTLEETGWYPVPRGLADLCADARRIGVNLSPADLEAMQQEARRRRFAAIPRCQHCWEGGGTTPRGKHTPWSHAPDWARCDGGITGERIDNSPVVVIYSDGSYREL